MLVPKQTGAEFGHWSDTSSLTTAPIKTLVNQSFEAAEELVVNILRDSPMSLLYGVPTAGSQ